MKWIHKGIRLLCLCTLCALVITVLIIGYSADNGTTSDKYEHTLISYCNDKILFHSVKERGNFYVLSNYVQARKEFRCYERVTFAAPADYRFLDNLLILVEKWRGPISVALYAPGYDFKATMDSISYVVFCTSHLISEYVSFHLFFEKQHQPPQITPLDRHIDCSEPPPYLNSTMNSYKQENKLLYPINVARNVAKEEAQTHFILVADIELFPTPLLGQKFLKMLESRPETLFSEEREVFVLPVFEVPAEEKIPDNKTVLQIMYNTKKLQIFHKKLCQRCHKVPDFDKWIKCPEDGKIDIFTSAKRQDQYRFWEPFYIGTNKEPFFDERLTWEGQSNKMTQGYLMCLLDYKYSILDDAFLVHKPGIKKTKEQIKNYSSQVGKTNKLKRVILQEYDILYGNRTGCKLV